MSEAPQQTEPERRHSRRVELSMALQVRLASPSHPAAPVLSAELINVGQDGRGAAVLLPQGSQVQLGSIITLLRSGQPDILGIVVSRLGIRARFRVGVRINGESQAPLRDWIAALAG